MIKNFRDTYYFISDEGKVYSNYRNDMKELKPQKIYRYLGVRLHINKKFKTVYIHRLVAECFIENYSKELEVNHIDLNKFNNNLNNLECITHKENIYHFWKSKNFKPKTQEEMFLKKQKRKEYIKKYQKEYRLNNKK